MNEVHALREELRRSAEERKRARIARANKLVRAERKCFGCGKKLQGTPRHYYHVYYCADCYPHKTCPSCGQSIGEDSDARR